MRTGRTISRLSRPGMYLQRVLSSFVVASVLLSLLAVAPPSVAAASCTTSSPSSGTYAVTVCLTQPFGGALVSGLVTVEASVTTSGAAPGVQRMVYTLDGNYLLSEFFAPYRFVLPSTQFVDGQHTLAVSALMSDGFLSAPTSLTLFFQNGVGSSPPIPTGFQPTSGSPPQAGQPFRIVAVGDGGDDGTYSARVAQLVASLAPNLFLYLGDLYEKGTYTEFLNYYGSDGQLFAAVRNVTNPVVGNHEYEGSIAEGYLRYWQSPPDFYSVDAGGWHLIALNSTSQFGQFTPGTPQYEWLLGDLRAHRDACTLVFFHHPRYSIGPMGDTPALQPIWELLYQFGVEIVLVGHDHNYQRWVPLDRTGQPDPNGIVQVVVGTGGHGIRGFVRSDTRVAAGFDQLPAAYGVAQLTLGSAGADYAFIDLQGQTRDQTSIACHGPNDVTAPTTPTNLRLTQAGPTSVSLAWDAAADDFAVTTYTVLRDGTAIGTTSGAVTAFVDSSVVPDRTYTYQVVASDAVGNQSAASAPLTVTVTSALFADDFETGSLDRWMTVNGLTVTTSIPHAGQYAARALSTSGTVAYAVAQLPSAQTDATVEVWFRIAARGTNPVSLVRLLTSSGRGVALVQVSRNGRLAYRNEVTGVTTETAVAVSEATWHVVQLRFVAGTAGRLELWYDGALVASTSQDFGTRTFGRLQVGEHLTGRNYDVVFDDVRVIPPPPPPPDTTPPETTITASPPPTTADTTASFSFTASEPATFRCSVDGAPPQPCTSPLTLTGLAIGIHTFSVAATDAAGNTDPTPASFAWEITAPETPETTLLSTPPALTNQDSATFTFTSFTSSDTAPTFECQLDTQPAVSCTSPWTVTGLPEGTHTFSVRAIDGDGDADPTPATWSWTIDRTPPAPPSDVSAVAVSGSSVTVSWAASSDPSGLAGYDLYRDGTLVVRLGPVTSFTDSTVQPAHSYQYTVRARDNAGNVSADSAAAAVTTPTLRLFEDDFESGNLIRWSTVNGLTVTSESAFSGTYAARALSTSGTAAYALATFRSPASESYTRVRFLLVSRGANTVSLLKWRAGTRWLGGVYLSSTGRLGFRNDVTGQSQTTTLAVTTGTWHTLEVHIRTGAGGVVEIWYDGSRVFQSFQDLGTDGVTQLQLGENSTGRTFDVRFDDVAADTGPIEAPADTTPPETTITAGPSGTTRETTATFAFTADELATFLCSLDAAPSQPCTSPVTYTGLGDGQHVFTVAAVDLAGNSDPTPARASWTVSTTMAPETTLTATPPALTASTDATFSFVADDTTATFQCQLDAESPVACTSPVTYSGLSEGGHTFAVWAVSGGGIADPSPATYSWTIDRTPPSAPTGLTANVGNGRVTLSWQPASDANGIAGYTVFRNDSPLVALGNTTTYTDTSVQPNVTYSYTVVARDQAGNVSLASDPVTVTVGTIVLFADDFETGTLGAWTTVAGLTLTTDAAYAGTYAARALSTSGTAAYAVANFSSTASELYVRVRFFVASQGANTVYLVKLRTASGASIGGLYVSSTGKLGFRNDVSGQSVTTTTQVTLGTWHTVLLHVVVGTTGSIAITYDGTAVAPITGNLGSDPVGRLQLGENSTGRTFDFRFDDVLVDTQPIGG